MKSDEQFLDTLREALIIDPDDLDRMLVEHAQLLYDAGVAYARAVSSRDAAKENVKVTDAKQAKTQRLALEEAGEKTTDAAINAAVLRTSEHRKSIHRWTKAVQESGELEALRDAYKARGFAIRDLVALRLAENYGTTSSDTIDTQARRRLRRSND